MKISHTIAAAVLVGSAASLTVAPHAVDAKPATYSAPPQYPTFSSPAATDPTAGCAVDVAPFVDQLAPGSDVTSAFSAAMSAAVAEAPGCYPAGPSGAPQAVVHVPAGTYRIANLTFPSNLRLEVDAGAELQLPPNRGRTKFPKVPLISWGGTSRATPALTNVSIVGVSQAMDDAKRDAQAQGGQAIAPFDLSTDFTMNLDAAQTNSTNFGVGISLTDVQHFLIQNVFSIQNDTDQVGPTNFAWPTSARPVLEFNARKDSPIGADPSTYLEPMYGSVVNHVDVDAPRGFGPNQVTGAQHVSFQDIYSQGGTALRLETDGATGRGGRPDRGATVDDLSASNIVGVDCNRALSLSPHAQTNGSVSVDGVWADSCFQGVVARQDGKYSLAKAGRFGAVDVQNVNVVAGDQAQNDSTTDLWTVGPSMARVYISSNLGWSPSIAVASASGTFTTAR